MDKVLRCFKTYDVRGKLGDELNEEIAYRIARATVQSLGAKTVVVGFDARESSPILAQSVIKGICDAGADALEIGCAGTEEMYSAVSEFNAGAGIEVTASHNPIEYNGIKIVKQGSKPLSENEFFKVKILAQLDKFLLLSVRGSVIDIKNKAREAYLKKITKFIELEQLRPLKIVINSGNGAAGPIIDELAKKLRAQNVETNFFYVHHDPDSSFPNGIPNPMIEENRSSTSKAVIKEKADFGVAFDGDFDRCFLFDNQGNFIPGEYVLGLVADVFLRKEHGATIVHDPRVIWNTINVVGKHNGFAVVSKTGHAFVKAEMRKAKAVYGGEMSAHHYFRDFDYCDSGMIPWLMVWQLLSQRKGLLSEIIFERKKCFPSSGELNFTVEDPVKCLQLVKDAFAEEVREMDDLDGISMSFNTWRFNLRKSNTEPLVRLNVETKGDKTLLARKTLALKSFIEKL